MYWLRFHRQLRCRLVLTMYHYLIISLSDTIEELLIEGDAVEVLHSSLLTQFKHKTKSYSSSYICFAVMLVLL